MWGRNAFTCSCSLSKLLSRQQLLLSGAQNLYTPAALGVNGFEFSRIKVKQQFQTLEEKFKEKMKEFADPASISTTIFTEDLKHMVHLAEETDLSVVRQMMIKFASQNKEMRFGSYIFGPVVMRMYYFLNKPQDALEAFKDPQLDGFFDQLVTFQILMDLLLINEKYDQVLEVFEHVKSKQLQGAKFPKNAVVLVFAACYKKNTPDSLQYAKQLWSDLNTVGHYPMRRAATFAAALAINQNDPGVALEILTTAKRQTYVTVRNLKVSALADLGRPDDALPILRNVLDFRYSLAFAIGSMTMRALFFNDPYLIVMEPIARANEYSGNLGRMSESDAPLEGQTHTFYRETISKMDAAVEKSNNPELSAEYGSIMKKLISLKLVIDIPLETQLCSDIEAIQMPRRDGRDGSVPFNQNFRKSGNRLPYRPGVMNMT